VYLEIVAAAGFAGGAAGGALFVAWEIRDPGRRWCALAPEDIEGGVNEYASAAPQAAPHLGADPSDLLTAADASTPPEVLAAGVTQASATTAKHWGGFRGAGTGAPHTSSYHFAGRRAMQAKWQHRASHSSVVFDVPSHDVHHGERVLQHGEGAGFAQLADPTKERVATFGYPIELHVIGTKSVEPERLHLAFAVFSRDSLQRDHMQGFGRLEIPTDSGFADVVVPALQPKLTAAEQEVDFFLGLQAQLPAAADSPFGFGESSTPAGQLAFRVNVATVHARKR
jgi:hypothetical protein